MTLLQTTIEQSVVEANTILRGVVGSTVHGIAIAETDDRDEMGIVVEPWEHYFGLRTRFEQLVYRTQDEGKRSGPGDLDLVIYSLTKWAALALRGNPTILILLFLPPSAIIKQTPQANQLRQLKSKFVTAEIFDRYLGYMRQQRQRLVNKTKMPNRPELIEQYGFDTKYAGHLVRLGLQGIELAETGQLSLPLKQVDKKLVVDIRKGLHSEQDVLAYAATLETRLATLKAANPLPPVDFVPIEEWVLDTYTTMHKRTKK